MFTTPTGVHFDAANVRLTPQERDVLYALAEHQLLRTPCAQLRGGQDLVRVADRLVRMGFIEVGETRWSDGVLTICGRLTREGEQFLTRGPLDEGGGMDQGHHPQPGRGSVPPPPPLRRG